MLLAMFGLLHRSSAVAVAVAVVAAPLSVCLTERQVRSSPHRGVGGVFHRKQAAEMDTDVNS